MASPGFYLVSASLLGGTALLVWLAVSHGSGGAAGSPDALQPAPADARAHGVPAADHDPAGVIADDAPLERRVDPNALAQGMTALPERTAPLAAPPAPDGPPVAASPGQTAESEVSAAAQPKIIAALRADLERRRDALRKACWPPGSDYAATFTIEASYAPDGALLALGASDVPGMPGVGTCLVGQIGQKPPELHDPPGVAVAVAVPLTFSGSEPPPQPQPRTLPASPALGD